jgi:hypothetical protein
MKPNQLIAFLLLFCCAQLAAQFPNLAAPKLYGGTKEDVFNAVIPTFGNGYIAVGYTWSSDFDGVGNRGSSDFFIAKFSASDQIEWKKTYGGAGFETGFAVRQTRDSGYIVAGDTYFSANTGDVGASKGAIDAWLLKLDKTGTIVWKRSYGGSESEGFSAIELTADDGILAVGYTASSNGDVTSNRGGDSDAWAIRLNADGSIKWQKTFGGTKRDEFYDVAKVGTDWVVVGFTDSQDGDIVAPKGVQDGWAMRLTDSTGAVVWKKNYGGTDFDGLNSVKMLPLVGVDWLVVTGASVSNNGDLSGNHGGFDAWQMRLDATTGAVDWSKLYGGTKDDKFNDLVYASGDLYGIGFTESNDGDIRRPYQGGGDAWLVKSKLMDGAIWGEQCVGGTLKDVANAFVYLPTIRNFIAVGSTKSTDGYFATATNRGGVSDAFVSRIYQVIDGVNDVKTNNIALISPNPADDVVKIELKKDPSVSAAFLTNFGRLSLVDALGKVVFSNSITENTFSISTKSFTNGVYFLKIESQEGRVWAVQKLVIQH